MYFLRVSATNTKKSLVAMPSFSSTLLFATVLGAIASAKADAAAQIASLKTAANEVDKVNLLQDQDVSILPPSATTGRWTLTGSASSSLTS